MARSQKDGWVLTGSRRWGNHSLECEKRGALAMQFDHIPPNSAVEPGTGGMRGHTAAQHLAEQVAHPAMSRPQGITDSVGPDQQQFAIGDINHCPRQFRWHTWPPTPAGL